MRQQHYEFKVIRMRAVRADVDPKRWGNCQPGSTIDRTRLRIDGGQAAGYEDRRLASTRDCTHPFLKRVCVAPRIPLAAYGEGRTLNESPSPFLWTDAPVTGRSAGLRGNGGAICLRVTCPFISVEILEDRDITASLPTTPTRSRLC